MSISSFEKLIFSIDDMLANLFITIEKRMKTSR
jgi:hypothetical protein